jgi:L-threonylcarbamoyladenylate synthase
MSSARIVPANEASIMEAADRLRRGLLVAFPTETVYGLGARVWDAPAERRGFEAKGRPEGHPLIAHVLGLKDARALAREWPEAAKRACDAFWPGPLTIVVPKIDAVPNEVTGGLDSIAIRAPAHPVARALLEALGEPIVAPSANRHQTISPTTAAHVAVSLGDADVLVLDGGACERGIESTVLDVRVYPARILRPGPIGLDALRAADIAAEMGSEAATEGAPRRSPGMSLRHYAPRATLLTASSDAELERFALLHKAAVLELSDDPERAAHDLYARLFELDDAGAAFVVVKMPPDTEAWRAVRDRLQRASTRK